MPTYQYRCTECGRDLEVVQRFSDAALTECPTCSGALRKVFNAVGVVFKGSGFYRTDSRNGDGKDATASSAADGGSGEVKSGEKPSGDKKSGHSGDSAATPTKSKEPAGAASAAS